tara:strand:+ start:293 stop:856 length:564 start_codon:yes stop_codon:yes gene_type:complete
VKVLIIDNFDSFTYNLYHYVREFVEDCIVVRSSDLSKFNIQDYDKIILSPGPSLPSDHPVIFDVLNRFSKTKSILGICLGHQAIVEFFGGKLENLHNVKHGISSENYILKSDSIFQGISKKMKVAHYHSWVAEKTSLPDCLIITSKNKSGFIMSIAHNEYDIKGLQFHPESVLTDNGKLIVKNWLFS